MAVYKVRAPALPLPTIEYEQRQQDQFQYALRLYFNQLDAYNQATASQVNSNTVLIWMDM